MDVKKLFEKEDYGKLHEVADKVLKINYNNFDAMLFKAELYYRQAKPTQAEKWAAKCINIDQNHSGANYLRALSLFELNRLDKALFHVDKALEVKDKFNFVILKAGILKKKNDESYSEWLEKARSMDEERFKGFQNFFE